MVSLNLEPRLNCFGPCSMPRIKYDVLTILVFQNPLENNNGKPVFWFTILEFQYLYCGIHVQYWIPVLFYSTILENTGQYWEILSFQYCEITSIVQYCTQKKTGFPVLSKLGIGLRQHTILVYQYCTNNTGTEKCSSICNNTGIPVSRPPSLHDPQIVSIWEKNPTGTPFYP